MEREGSMAREGVAVYEVFTGQVDFAGEAAERFRQDPEAYMKQYLEEQGFEVNGVRPRYAEGGQLEPDPSPEARPVECRWWHEVWPAGSYWEWACY